MSTERKFIGQPVAEHAPVVIDEPIPVPIVIVEIPIDEWDKLMAFELFGVLQ